MLISLVFYLQLKNVTTPLNYFDGELFKVDVTCDGIEGGAHKKLMFKYNGTRILTNKGIRNTVSIAIILCII